MLLSVVLTVSSSDVRAAEHQKPFVSRFLYLQQTGRVARHARIFHEDSGALEGWHACMSSSLRVRLGLQLHELQRVLPERFNPEGLRTPYLKILGSKEEAEYILEPQPTLI